MHTYDAADPLHTHEREIALLFHLDFFVELKKHYLFEIKFLLFSANWMFVILEFFLKFLETS